MASGITRRALLEGASGVLALAVLQLRCGPGDAPAPGGAGPDPGGAAPVAPEAGAPLAYRDFRDLYRSRWVWDRVAKGTHFVNCWYQRGCNWNVFVKDGIVFREEQAGAYPQTHPGVPDFNPRGCQKGACYSERMYDAARLRHPLKRVGARGEGLWKRVTWEEALGEIAEATVDVLTSDGPEAIVWDQGTAQTNGCAGLGTTRTSFILDTPILDVNADIGDHHPGAAVTCGKISFCSSADDLFYSDLILIWGGNPTYTQIPNAHFINEARYHGAQVVTIAPDYNASAVHADQWIPVEVASDAAFGLSLAHVMVEEGLHDAAFVKEQTDLPLLVRTDTRRFLRASDLPEGGDEETFYVHDRAAGALRPASRRSLALEAVDPALEGEFRVRTSDGETTVTPVFALLRRQLAAYSPEAAERTTGVPPATVRGLARALAGARAATCITQSNFSKFYHAIEMERAQLLVFALAGQIGRKGAGFMGFPYLSLAGPGGLSVASGSLPPRLALKALQLKVLPEALKLKLQGYTPEMILFELSRREYAGRGFPSTLLWLYRHADLQEYYGGSKAWDPTLKRELDDFLSEAVEKGWHFVPETPPRILFEDGGNLLRRVRAHQKVVEVLLPRLDLLVTMDWRMSNTALHSDFVLPAAAWYEKDDITWATTLTPFTQVVTRAAEPLSDSRPDWEFHCLLLKEIQRIATERGIRSFRDRAGRARRLDRVYDRFTFGGRYTESNVEEFLEEILAATTNLDGIGWEELKDKGFHRFTEIGSGYLNVGNATDISTGETITANTWHTEKKQPWPTLTRRMQFYIDHEFYMELGEELPVHKDNPAIGGAYPLQMTGGHTRWSIHASWRDQKHMLQLSRGVPHVYVGLEDAAERGIVDGDEVRVFNDIGSFELQAKVSPALRPGQVVVYHAWEPYQFRGRRSHASVTPSPINPLSLAGGYFHLQPRPAVGTPGSVDRATRVELERVSRSWARPQGTDQEQPR
jgi:DMSO reductase family type II enzyme molybdopterin subunit